MIDGEAVPAAVTAEFRLAAYRRHDASVFLYAFDLIELDGADLRREPLEVRKATLISVLAKAVSGVRLNEHMECDDGEMVFLHACKLGLEGIVQAEGLALSLRSITRLAQDRRTLPARRCGVRRRRTGVGKSPIKAPPPGQRGCLGGRPPFSHVGGIREGAMRPMPPPPPRPPRPPPPPL